MGADEFIDEITATGTFVAPKSRSSIHTDGLWHQVFHCLIVRSSEPTSVVLQRRCAEARSFPNRLDLSATGHLLSGETPLDGARELREELGITVQPDALTHIGTRLLADDSGEGKNRERIHLFFLSDDRPLTDFAPDPTEVQSLVEIKIDDLLQVLNDPEHVAEAIEWSPEQSTNAVTIEHQQLVSPVDGYWNVLLVMADRFAKGQYPLAI